MITSVLYEDFTATASEVLFPRATPRHYRPLTPSPAAARRRPFSAFPKCCMLSSRFWGCSASAVPAVLQVRREVLLSAAQTLVGRLSISLAMSTIVDTLVVLGAVTDLALVFASYFIPWCHCLIRQQSFMYFWCHYFCSRIIDEFTYIY